jgi:hypothetical protein
VVGLSVRHVSRDLLDWSTDLDFIQCGLPVRSLRKYLGDDFIAGELQFFQRDEQQAQTRPSYSKKAGEDANA